MCGNDEFTGVTKEVTTYVFEPVILTKGSRGTKGSYLIFN
jgi:hypothetical protein